MWLSFGHQDARAASGCGKKLPGDPGEGAGIPTALPALPRDSLIALEIVPLLAWPQE